VTTDQIRPGTIANAAARTAFLAATVIIAVVLTAAPAAARAILWAWLHPSAALLFRGETGRAATLAIGGTDGRAATALLSFFQTSVAATVTAGRLPLADALCRATFVLDARLTGLAPGVARAGFLVADFAFGAFFWNALVS
jgi:hypothetical protein